MSLKDQINVGFGMKWPCLWVIRLSQRLDRSVSVITSSRKAGGAVESWDSGILVKSLGSEAKGSRILIKSPRSKSAPGVGECIPSSGCVFDRNLN
jgi:hypothetical protein